MGQNVSNFVIERLHAWGIRRIYGYPGRRHQRRSWAR